MSRVFSFLLWLVILALPMQGFAAASMLYCGVGPEHQAVQADVIPEGHHHAQGSADQHDHAMHDEAPTQVAEQTTQSPDMQTQLPDATHKCGVCASCCNLIGITDVQQTVATHIAPEAQFSDPLALNYSVSSRLPEKPPRA